MSNLDSLMDESLVPAPTGLPEESLSLEELFLGDDEEGTPEEMEVEITEDADGGATLLFGEEEEAPLEAGFDENLAEVLPEREIGQISSELREAYQDDRASRSDWEQQYSEGLALLGLTYENRTA